MCIYIYILYTQIYIYIYIHTYICLFIQYIYIIYLDIVCFIFITFPRAWLRGQHPSGPVVVDWDMDGEYELLLTVAGGFPMSLGFWNEYLKEF